MHKFSLKILWAFSAVGIALVGISFRTNIEKGLKAEELLKLNFSSFLASRSNNIPEDDYFLQLAQLLKSQFVDDIAIDNKLATGAIKGMIESLNDPNSRFMNFEQLTRYRNSLNGIFEGIGIDARTQFKPEQLKAIKEKKITDAIQLIPDLIISSILPGSPAQKAGLKAGDIIYSVNNHWVVSYNEITDFRNLQKEAVKDKDKQSILQKARIVINKKLKTSFTPFKARELLTTGQKGNVDLIWYRKNSKMSAKINKTKIIIPAIIKNKPDLITLRFFKGAEKSLKNHIQNKKQITIDLRNSTNGDFNTMKSCMELLVSKGKYADLITLKNKDVKPFSIMSGNANPPQITLLVDHSTVETAEMFASTLALNKNVKISGSGMVPNRFVTSTVSLPEGNGYTLTTYEFKPNQHQQSLPKKTTYKGKIN